MNPDPLVLQGGAVYVAPLGADPSDPTQWEEVGLTTLGLPYWDRLGFHRPEELLAATRRLTAPRNVPIRQEVRDGVFEIRVGTRDPLLLELREALAGTVGGGGGRADPREFIPLNPDALELYSEIMGRLREAWETTVGRPMEGSSAEESLTLLVDAILAPPYDSLRHGSRLTTRLTRWADRIERLFFPTRKIEVTHVVEVPVLHPVTRVPLVDRRGNPRTRPATLPAACPRPECGERSAFDRVTGNKVVALLIEYRLPEGGGDPYDVTGTCRACGWTWRDVAGLEQLNQAIDAAA